MSPFVSRSVLGVGLSLAASLICPTDAAAARFYNVIRNIESQLCLDIPSFSQGNVLVQQYPCNYRNNQFWTLEPTAFAGWFFVKALHSGKCLEIPGWSTADGAKLQHYTCNGGTNQMWYPVDLGGGETAYVNGYSGKCIDIAGGSHSAGYQVQQYTCHYGDNQAFEPGEIGVSVSG